MKWTPIFEKDGQEFIVPSENMVGDSENAAWEIAMGTMLVEGVLMGFKPTNPVRYLKLDDEGKANVKGWNAKLGTWDIVILDTAAAKEAGGLKAPCGHCGGHGSCATNGADHGGVNCDDPQLVCPHCKEDAPGMSPEERAEEAEREAVQ